MVIVNKYGMKFYTREHTRNAGGEQGETEGLLRYLSPCIYFGVMEGEIPGVINIKPHLDGVDHECTAAHQRMRWEEDLHELSKYEITHAIQVNGMAPTFSTIDNATCATIQSFAARNCAPWLNVLQSLKLPRICVNNDPRSYPCDQEMSYGWDWARPRALLDQCSREWNRVVGRKKYLIRSVYGACESFGYLPERDNLKENKVAVVSHIHHWGKADWSFFEEYRKRYDITPYGTGWPAGKLSPQGVLDEFRRSLCGIVVSHTPGFLTGKPYVMVSQGCVPIMADSRPDYRYHLKDIDYVLENYEECLAYAKQYFKPDFSHIDRVLNGEDYGGYLPR